VTAAYVHPTAHIEDGVTIGDGTRIWHQGHIRGGAVIGSGCNLGKNVFVDSGVQIGNGVKIQNNVSVYHGVTIEDDVFVGPSAVFTNDRYPRAFSTDWEVVETTVRKGASIGANATLVCGIEVGEYAVVAAGSVVPKTVQSHQIVMGSPARHYAWACKCGRVASRSQDRPEDLRCETCRANDTAA
jgi:UDP-2-acetamido-3-amino-2,3-dideoxy-glucuronate N-acetyltransferase